MIPTILMTGHYLDFNRAAALSLGAAEYLPKPIFLDELLPIVRRFTSAPPDLITRLHERILLGDSGAIDTLVRVFLLDGRRRLRWRFPHADPQQVEQAVEDAILHYIRNPAEFNAACGTSLSSFLALTAWRRLANAVKSEGRRKRREAMYASSKMIERNSPIEVIELHRTVVDRLLEREADLPMRAALSAWLEGNRSTAPFAGLPCWLGLQPRELAREVKRRKDRFVKQALRQRHR